MELKSISVKPSPDDPQRVRLQGRVSYDDKDVPEDNYWFDVPEGDQQFLSQNGNPWLACLLPVAVALGEPLRLSAPVDPILLRGVHEVMDVWKWWFSHLQPVRIDADVLLESSTATPKRVASFFSGGVDSFFTVLRHEGTSNPALKIEELLYISGFDIPLQDKESGNRMLARNTAAAEKMGKKLTHVSTNLRDTRFGVSDWLYISHGPALAAVALALEDKYSTVLVAPSVDYGHLVPMGSHPTTDMLFSTRGFRMAHDGAGYTRSQRIGGIYQSELARETLHMCWHTRTDANCCRCRKCTLTIAVLDILGVLDQFPTINCGSYSLMNISRIFCMNVLVADMLQDLHSYATAHGREDVARAAIASLRRSRMLRSCLPLLTKMENHLFIGWPATRLKERLVRDLLWM